MSTLKKNYLIQKRNTLNELRSNNMTLQELRFFSIYLSKINAKDISTRIVRFSLSDFKAIMELSNVKPNYIQGVTDGLLCKVVNVPDEHGGYTGFQIFKKCKVSKDDNEEWYVEIDAHDDALPLMFEFKSKYFTYQLWNALRLKSSNQLRMYEILKQYQIVGYRIIAVKDLKALLGIEESEYPQWERFRVRVLNACQQALAEHTDIKFTYEPHGKKGKGGKILNLKFTIEKNDTYKDQLTLDMFIDEQKLIETDTPLNLNDIKPDDTLELLDAGIITPKEDRLISLRDAVNDEFSIEQVNILYDIMIRDMPGLIHGNDLELYHHFMAKYNYMKEKHGKGEIRTPFGYLKSIIGKS